MVTKIIEKNDFHPGDDLLMEEEIGVEVKKIMRTNSIGTVGPLRELNEEEKLFFTDSYLGSTVDNLVPSVRAERKLTQEIKKIKRRKMTGKKKRTKVQPAHQKQMQRRKKKKSSKRRKKSHKR
ncbi:MAG: hypothetical protein H7839_10985 [Magnetococcus sp. YQC-5]